MDNWRSRFNRMIIKRGYQIFENEQLGDIEINNNIIHANVYGTDIYDVEIGFDDDSKITYLECDCPYAHTGYYCKHMAAVLYEVENSDLIYNYLDRKYNEDNLLEDIQNRIESLTINLRNCVQLIRKIFFYSNDVLLKNIVDKKNVDKNLNVFGKLYEMFFDIEKNAFIDVNNVNNDFKNIFKNISNNISTEEYVGLICDLIERKKVPNNYMKTILDTLNFKEMDFKIIERLIISLSSRLEDDTYLNILLDLIDKNSKFDITNLKLEKLDYDKQKLFIDKIIISDEDINRLNKYIKNNGNKILKFLLDKKLNKVDINLVKDLIFNDKILNYELYSELKEKSFENDFNKDINKMAKIYSNSEILEQIYIKENKFEDLFNHIIKTDDNKNNKFFRNFKILKKEIPKKVLEYFEERILAVYLKNSSQGFENEKFLDVMYKLSSVENSRYLICKTLIMIKKITKSKKTLDKLYAFEAYRDIKNLNLQ